MSYQKLIVVGNLTRDPELVDAGSGQVCRFAVATNEKWTDKNGEDQQRTTYFDVDVWGKRGAVCAKYLHKGRQVFVEGRVRQRDHDGKRYWTINANDVQFLGGKPQGQRRQVDSEPGFGDYDDDDFGGL